ncbi:methyltransferase family protein [Actinokineospora auranticolor]|uniref:Methyltransferase family protein n=1 Tax=Actinokineospora auranticolor TaxID=155976 RepID=A0A2S6GNY5_9PSEU|nr:methyltransferase family protein [Actinokineospora auranticolor]
MVANRDMNRERGLAAYRRELGIELPPAGSWLDLCCGTGRALLECASDARVTGVDLVAPPPHPRVEFHTASVLAWEPEEPYDLITCVHGLHYVGDKLAALTRIAAWLTPNGLFTANLDAASIEAPRPVRPLLRQAGFTYDSRRKRISLEGGRQVTFPLTYLGADDKAGPNYTGQPAVTSHYT